MTSLNESISLQKEFFAWETYLLACNPHLVKKIFGCNPTHERILGLKVHSGQQVPRERREGAAVRVSCLCYFYIILTYSTVLEYA
jgi:hypothetical protein